MGKFVLAFLLLISSYIVLAQDFSLDHSYHVGEYETISCFKKQQNGNTIYLITNDYPNKYIVKILDNSLKLLHEEKVYIDTRKYHQLKLMQGENGGFIVFAYNRFRMKYIATVFDSTGNKKNVFKGKAKRVNFDLIFSVGNALMVPLATENLRKIKKVNIFMFTPKNIEKLKSILIDENLISQMWMLNLKDGTYKKYSTSDTVSTRFEANVVTEKFDNYTLLRYYKDLENHYKLLYYDKSLFTYNELSFISFRNDTVLRSCKIEILNDVPWVTASIYKNNQYIENVRINMHTKIIERQGQKAEPYAKCKTTLESAILDKSFKLKRNESLERTEYKFHNEYESYVLNEIQEAIYDTSYSYVTTTYSSNGTVTKRTEFEDHLNTIFTLQKNPTIKFSIGITEKVPEAHIKGYKYHHIQFYAYDSLCIEKWKNEITLPERVSRKPSNAVIVKVDSNVVLLYQVEKLLYCFAYRENGELITTDEIELSSRARIYEAQVFDNKILFELSNNSLEIISFK